MAVTKAAKNLASSAAVEDPLEEDDAEADNEAGDDSWSAKAAFNAARAVSGKLTDSNPASISGKARPRDDESYEPYDSLPLDEALDAGEAGDDYSAADGHPSIEGDTWPADEYTEADGLLWPDEDNTEEPSSGAY